MMHVEHCGMGDGGTWETRSRGGGGLSMNEIIESYPQPLDAPQASIAIHLGFSNPPPPYRFIPSIEAEEYKGEGSIRLDDCDSFAVQVGYRWLIELQTSCPGTA